MRIYLCGVRGSTPAPGAAFLRYGGHTSCVAIAHDGDTVPTLVLDAGTGVRRVTGLLAGLPFSGTIVLTHLHWDHVHGLPFFTGGDRDGARVSVLLPEPEDGRTAQEALAGDMSPPHFPITPAGLRGDWAFGSITPGSFKAEGFTVEAREIPHKGGRTFGYRVSDGRAVLAYLPGHHPVALGPGPDGWGAYHPAPLGLAATADLLIHDAHLLAGETGPETSYGHAAAEYAVGLGIRAGAKRIMLAHHKPDRTDDELDQLQERLRARFPATRVGPAEVTVAAEGSTIQL